MNIFKDKHFLLLFAIFVAFLFSIYLQFTHPAYKSYKEYNAQLRHEYDDFRKHVSEDFVPALSSIYSNVASVVVSQYSSDDDVSFSMVSNSVTVSKNTSSSDVDKPVDLDAFVCRVQSEFILYYKNWAYRVSDSFFGSPIISISPTCVKTMEKVFYITGSPVSSVSKSSSKTSSNSSYMVSTVDNKDTTK